MSRKPESLYGQRFGSLVVQGYGGLSKQGVYLWECLCDCGQTTKVFGTNLKTGRTKGCGHHEHRTADPMVGSRPYRIYHGMLQRCINSNTQGWRYYGALGVKVCERWRESFKNFWEDMAEGYSDELTIDRIDGTGNYEPGNCRWATWTEQHANKKPRPPQSLAREKVGALDKE